MRRISLKFVWTMVVFISCLGIAKGGETGFLPKIIKIKIDTVIAKPGDKPVIEYWWKNVGGSCAQKDYAVFVHFVPEGKYGEKNIVFGGDYRPTHPTTTWFPGEVIIEKHYFKIPSDVPPGRYKICIGLWDPTTGARIKLANEEIKEKGTKYRICVITIVEKESKVEKKPLEVNFEKSILKEKDLKAKRKKDYLI
ncbi:hypothetical protein J7K56_02400, partial [Candidatus Calescamantes bacterium]|nr:hypothetical protein [Candidatus Calescamantes bacterium]